MKTTIGTCGACGGPVTVPTVWMGVNPPIPQCEHCHRTPKHSHGPVIPMEERPDSRVTFVREQGQVVS